MIKISIEQKLINFGARNDGEKEWTKQHLAYLFENRRQFFYLCELNESDILNLIFKGEADKDKVIEIRNFILKDGWHKSAVCFFRDLNEGEEGLFYVENGIHRITALQELIKGKVIKCINIKAILIAKTAFNNG